MTCSRALGTSRAMRAFRRSLSTEGRREVYGDLHHTLDELAKATTVLETGGVFDPNVGPGVSPVSQVRPIAENPKSGGVH